ncbi:Rab GDP dissociation inhibitor alpha [Clydaea vesicula]|uniref:Rab GDP dissociation inhibitor n=1 Tax=Clydaea vesicula TaxID=447962 RepID=A0AAD5XTS6_9FUNG|nr:Rab GDP dissociation inhibitor alpha [Clydaea vesicula]
MNETYDVIVLGTGLSQYLSLDGKKVLQIDENPYYGGESASLNLVQLTEKFKDANLDLKELNSKDWAVDLIPKFLLSNGEIVDMLHYSNIPRYVEFKQIDGTFILKNGSISKVPTTEVEALTSSLIDLAEKNRLKIFLEFIKSYVSEDVSTHQGVDLCSIKMRDLFEKFNLSKETQDIVGHSLALNQDDAYLDEIAKDTVNRISLYVTSVARFGKSPFIYPLYGLGELSQGFSRLSAVNGATFM